MKERLKEMLDSLEVRTRNDGKEFICLKDNVSEDMQNTIRDIHGIEFLPDDFRYETILNILERVFDYSFETKDELEELGFGICDNLVSAYNHELNAWFSSNLLRAEYVNEAVNENYCEVGQGGFDITQVIRAGQFIEIQEIYNNLMDKLDT